MKLRDEKPWVDVIRGNRNTSNGRVIQFVAPKVVDGIVEVEIEEEDVISEIQYCETSTIMYTIGVGISMHAVKII